ncbi:hypothetical protein LM240_10860 [Pseudomonas aeruginosa]|nr:hypothetical protein [Pseudomonas aeruginosa]
MSGTGADVCYSTAAAWYRKAAEQGNELAKTKLQKLSEIGVKPALLSVFGEKAATRRSTSEKPGHSKPMSDFASRSNQIEVAPCPICHTKIAKHIMKRHIAEYHRPEPNIGPQAPRTPRIKKPSGPVLPVSSAPAHRPAKAALESLCPRCGGDGGVRGGCTKCDGTGWVSLAMEHDVVYRPDKSIGENSRVSNSDYLGGNGGAHFREIDGRIGTIPSHDDYSEES